MTSDKFFMKRFSSFKPLMLFVQIGLICGLTVAGTSAVFAGAKEQAKRMHDRLAGIPPTKEMLCAMETLIAAGDAEGAAHLVMTTDPITDSTLLTACDQQANVGNNNGQIDNDLSKKAFYSVSLKNFVTPWTNEERTVLADLNDYSALVIGMIRDNVPFNTVLSNNYFYKGVDVSLPSVSADNNDHYVALQNGAYDLSDDTVLVGTEQDANITQINEILPNGAVPAGVVTTRAASLAFFTGGTNRLMWRATSMNFLCRDLEQMKDVSRGPDRIRQDVSRSPGGDSSIFLSACMGCHAGMDPLAGAYAYYDHEVEEDGTPTGHMLWKQNSTMFGGAVSTGVGEDLFNQNCTGGSCHSQGDKRNRTVSQINDAIANDRGGMSVINLDPSEIQAIADFLAGNDTAAPITVTQKYLINSGNFKYGYVTVDDEWTNYWREGPNSALEWGWDAGSRTVYQADGSTVSWDVPDSGQTISHGNGPGSLGYEVTSTKAFAQCQVEKVYKFVCLHDPINADTTAIAGIVDAMPGDQYNMKNVFAKVAPLCMGD